MARALLPACLALVVGLATAACEPTLHTDTGIVTSVDSPRLGTVTGFELRTDDGRVLAFDTRGLVFEEGAFPAAHLSEHRASADPVRVTYRTDDGRNVVVKLVDATDRTVDATDRTVDATDRTVDATDRTVDATDWPA